jgi:hypothetical protein
MVVTWTDHAACQGLEPMFDTDSVTQQTHTICAACPVRPDCYHAIMSGSREYDYGIWGGLGRQQRLRIRDGRSTRAREWQRNLTIDEEQRWTQPELPPSLSEPSFLLSLF